jgi:mRNA interferase MazF
MNKWDVVLIRYPFTDLSQAKARPALAIFANASGEDAIFIALTSNTDRGGAHDILIRDDDPEFPPTGLRETSAIKVDKIFTLKKTLVARHMGRLGPAHQGKVEQQLRTLLQLPPYQPALKGSQ